MKSKLTTTNDPSLFNITPIIGISKNRINQESITFNQKEIIEYDCIVDSLYAISMVKIGILKNAISEKNVEIRTKNIPEREGYFNYDIATPYPLENIDMYNVPYFNTSILPMEEIQKIEMFVEGDILSKEYINERFLAYKVKASRMSFSFNEENKKDLEYICRYGTIFFLYFILQRQG